MTYADRHDYMRIPIHTLESLNAYVETGRPPGGFLMAVLTNDLMGAFAQADLDNMDALGPITSYVYNRIPGAAWRSKKTVKEWIDGGGAAGVLGDSAVYVCDNLVRLHESGAAGSAKVVRP